MDKKLQAEAHVLDRIMYLLEEGSVRRLMQQDDKFARYIQDLYTDVHDQSAQLHTASRT